MNTNLSSLSIVHRRMLGCRACAIYLARHGEQPHTQPSSSNHTATTHQALEPVAHYTRLNNYFNKQQSSSPSWTVLERRAHNTIFQISIKSKCWESSSRPLPLPLYQSTTLFRFLSLSLSLFATLRLPIAALRFFTWKQPWGGRGEPCWSFTFRIWLLTFSKYINIFFMAFNWYCLSGLRKGTQVHGLMKMCCKRLRGIAPQCFPDHLEQCVGKSLLAQVQS